MYISESRLVGGECQHNDLIGPGSQTICHAMATISSNNKSQENKEVKVKLDSCGSVSIAHSQLLTEVKVTKEYKLRNIRLRFADDMPRNGHYIKQIARK